MQRIVRGLQSPLTGLLGLMAAAAAATELSAPASMMLLWGGIAVAGAHMLSRLREHRA